MSENYPKDPVAMWRDMLGQWEKGVNAMTTQTMAKGEFSREMNRVLGVSLKMQKASQELVSRYFDALNLPTKDDLNALGERLQAMEEQITRVADAVDRMAGSEQKNFDGAPQIKRTKRYTPPPAEEKS